jgi:glycosyltransferase involved in cell wall biosynthesis
MEPRREGEQGVAHDVAGPTLRLDGAFLIVAPLPPPIMGPSAQTELILGGLRAAGVRISHVDTRDERPIFNVGILDLRNVALGVLHAGQMLLAARRPVDLVYISISQSRWGYVRDAVLLAIARLFRRRIVVHFHGAQFQKFYACSGRFDRQLIQRTLSWVDAAIVLTPGLRNNFDGLIAPSRIRVLENAIPDPFPDGVGQLGARRQQRGEREAGALRLLYIANDFGAKGAETAIRSLAEPGLELCELRMIGEPSPEDLESATSLAARLGVRDRVFLLGLVEGAPKFAELAGADAFVYPTEYDAQPLVVLEAMAAALPIVASDHGGIPETLGGAGLLVPEADHRALAERVRRLIDEPQERSRLGRAARERYLERYTPELFKERLRMLFAELLRA